MADSGLPDGFVPAFSWVKTEDGVVEYVHPAGEAIEKAIAKEEEPPGHTILIVKVEGGSWVVADGGGWVNELFDSPRAAFEAVVGKEDSDDD